MRASEPQARIDPEQARALAARAFRRAGVPAGAAGDAAEVLTIAEMMGIGTHGLGRVRTYVERIAAGGLVAGAEVEVSAPSPALRRVDGRHGLGPATARQALRAALEAAQACGVGAALVTGGAHLGALAPYLWLAAEAGCAALITTNTAPMLAPAGGRAALIGNNPLGIGLPGPEGAHVLLDMALSVAARSRVRAAAEAGAAIPPTWATDAAGHPTTDARAAMAGLMQAIGGGKGASLALCLDLLAAGLSGAAMLAEVPDAGQAPGARQNLGQMVVAIDVARLLPLSEHAARMQAAAAMVGTSAPVDAAHPPRLPGARAVAAMRRAAAEGLVLPAGLLADLRALAGAQSANWP